MSWLTYIDDLRRLLSDQPNDKLRHRKRVLGIMNGVNVTFKTLEFRRVTDFTTAVSPLGVYVNGVAATVSSDSASIGEFNLAVAPVDGDVTEATYYIQWFTDDEITGFMQSAADWLLIGNIADIPSGLRPAALHYGAQVAYQKLAVKWSEYLTETYRLEDAPHDGAFKIVETYQASAMDMHKKSFDLRDSYYTRSGQSLQPNFTSLTGAVPDPVPKR